LQNKHDMGPSIARASGDRSGSVRRDTASRSARAAADLAVRDAATALGITDLSIRRAHGKIVISGVARCALDREKLFEALKQLDSWERDVVLDVSVERHDVRGYHTVEPGETLASIAERFLGSAERELEIFDANRDRMNDPDQILAGQQLLIPKR
jgi:nucleoid-associated protein YgaU